MDETIFKRMPDGVKMVRNAPLRDYTTFQLGGPCPVLFDCPDAETLTTMSLLLYEASVPFVVIGQGSNLLVADAGSDHAVLRYCAEGLPQIQFNGESVRVSGHTLLDDLAQATIQQGLGDLTFCCGIPGTVGGAICGNAGAFGRQIGDVVESVRLLAFDGSIRVATAAELVFSYRSSHLKKTGEIVLDAMLKLVPAEVKAMEQAREEIMLFRRSRHPDWRTMPCAGSVFRNIEPTSAADRRQAAGWFLEEAGARRLHVGQAHLFEKHANIIIANSGATARDVFELTEQMIGCVREKFGFDLIREIQLLGAF